MITDGPTQFEGVADLPLAGPADRLLEVIAEYEAAGMHQLVSGFTSDPFGSTTEQLENMEQFAREVMHPYSRTSLSPRQSRLPLRSDDGEVGASRIEHAEQRLQDTGVTGGVEAVEPAAAEQPEQLRLGEREGEVRRRRSPDRRPG